MLGKSSKGVRWVSPVGDDPVTGGGVARALSIFKSKNFFGFNASYLSLLNLSNIKQIRMALSDIYRNGYKTFVIHSVFSPYSLVLLCVPVKLSVVILLHGELAQEALKIGGRKKTLCLFVFKLLKFFLSRYKHISVIATSDEEIEFSKEVLPVYSSHLLPDLVDSNITLNSEHNYDNSSGINLVIIARLVKNKGVGDFLEGLLHTLSGDASSAFCQIDKINLFVTPESTEELERVQTLQIAMKTIDMDVNLYQGLTRSEMCSELNSLPNKLAFLSSKFESFSYVLLETLAFEYKPVVWFENGLVKALSSEGLCVPVTYGTFHSVTYPHLCQRQSLSHANQFVDGISDKTEARYADLFRILLN